MSQPVRILLSITQDTAEMKILRFTSRSTTAPVHRLADTLPHANEFIRDVLDAASAASFGSLAWPDINRLAARRLRPIAREGQTNSSQLGHAVVIEMAEQGIIEAELTTTADGTPMVVRVLRPCVHRLPVSPSLAA